MGKKNKGDKRKRSTSKSPQQFDSTKDVNKNVNNMSTTCPNTPHTPIANQLNETHSVLYGQNMQYINGQSGSLSVGNPMPVSTPFQSYPMAPPTTPANALSGNPSQLIFSPQSPHLPAMYEKFEKFMFDCSQKLQKLDLLDQIINKIDVMEKKYDNLEKKTFTIFNVK